MKSGSDYLFRSIFIVVLFGPFFLSAQGNERLDSLEAVLKTLPQDTQKVRLYFDIYDQLSFNDPAKAEAYIQEALELALSLNDQRGVILCYDKLGGVAMGRSEFDRAVYYYQKVDSLLQYIEWPREQAVIYGNFAAIYKDTGQYDSCLVWVDRFLEIANKIQNESFQAFGLTLKGDVYHIKGQNELASRNYIEALRIYERLGEKDRMADALRLLAASQTTAGMYADAQNNFEHSVAIYKEVNDDYYLAQSYRGLGYLFQLKNELDRSEEYYNRSMEISRRLEDPFGIAQTYAELGESAFLKKQYERALEFKKTALHIFQNIEDAYSEGITHREIGAIQLELNQYAQAQSSLQIAEEILTRLEAASALRFLYQTYHKLYRKLNQPEEALDAFEKYTILNDSIYTIEKARQIEELQLIYKVEKKDQEIAMLAKDVALGKLQRRSLFFGIIASVLIGGLIIYIQLLRRKRDRKIAEERHARQEAELEKNQLAKEQVERELAGQVLQLCRKNELLASLQQEIADLSKQSKGENKSDFRRLQRSIQSDIQSDEDWRQFLATFEKVHPQFLAQLRQQTDKLSPAEQRLSCLFKMNLSSKEIATLLNISDEGVKKARYRLRKKLDLSSNINLQEYLINFPQINN